MLKTAGVILLVLYTATISFAQEEIEKAIQRQFIMAEAGELIKLDSGIFEITGSLWLDDKQNITIRGQGKDKTILSFKNQTEGAEGLKITNSQNITIEHLTVQDAKGDAIKTQEVNGITFQHVKTAWTGKPNKKNGAYGLYPVQCQQVLIDNCEAVGASDAGIYVGQSDHIIVRNSRAYRNVAGIEIENSTHADVYNNVATGNTGGILIFDLPGLIKKKGCHVRVFNNRVIENNFKNFAPKGNMVAGVPPGTGIMVMATSDVEVFDNEIRNNRTLGTAIVSYYMTELPIEDDQYDPYPTSVYIYDNTYTRKNRWPTLSGRFGKLLWWKFGKKVPAIIYDGILHPELLNEQGTYTQSHQICVSDNDGGTFVNLNAENGFKNISSDVSQFDCKRQKLPSVNLQTGK